MRASYQILETRRLANDVVLGYVAVDFSPPGRPILSVHLSVIVRRTGDTWLITHHQVSRL